MYPYRTRKIPGKEGKNAQKQKNKEILAKKNKRNSKENQKNKGRRIWEWRVPRMAGTGHLLTEFSV